MEFRLQIGVPDHNGTDLVSVEEYLQLHSQGKAAWTPYLTLCDIFLEFTGKEWLASGEWGFGRIDYLILAFEEACKRLSVGKEAIIRSGDPETRNPPFLFLEPSDDEIIFVTLFFIKDKAFRPKFFFGEELYSYVHKHYLEIVQTSTNSSIFKKLPCPKHLLIESLKKEADLGRQLVALIGIEGGHWL